MASSSSASSSVLWPPNPWKYNIFLNFRGEDTSCNFISHLYAALCQMDLVTFFDNDELKRGEEIALSLLKAIQDSTAAFLIFSKDYASSTWCLDELATIENNYGKAPSYKSYGSKLGKLTSLSSVTDKSISHLPNSGSELLEALEVPSGGCSNLNTFPKILGNIKRPNLNGITIKQVLSSRVELINKLKKLWMINCRELESLPSNFVLTSLKELNPEGSSRSKAVSEILEPMDNLEQQ